MKASLKSKICFSYIFVCSFLAIIFLFSCKKNSDSYCYRLKVIYKYNGDTRDCSSSVLRVETAGRGEIPVGSYVTISTNEGETAFLEENQIIYFRLKMSVEAIKEPSCTYDITYHLHGDYCK